MDAIGVAQISERIDALVRHAASGSHEAFAEIMELYDRDLASVCHIVCRDFHTGEDALQGAWSSAWINLGRLRDSSKLRPWLLRIAGREARRLARRERPTAQLADLDLLEGRRDRTPDPERVDLASALSALAPQDRELIALRYALGFTSREIEEMTGLNASSVRGRLAAALDRLRSWMSDE